MLEDGSKSIFHYIQILHSQQQQKPDKKRVWDSPYSLVYQERGAMSGKGWSTQFVSQHLGTQRLPKGDVIQYLQRKAKVQHFPISTALKLSGQLQLASELSRRL